MADSWQLSELSDSPRAWPLVLTYMCFFKTHVFFLLLFVCFKGSPQKKRNTLRFLWATLESAQTSVTERKKTRKIGKKTLGDWNIMGISNHLQDASEGGNGQWTRSQTHCLLRNFRGGPPWLGANGEINEFLMFLWDIMFWKNKPPMMISLGSGWEERWFGGPDLWLFDVCSQIFLEVKFCHWSFVPWVARAKHNGKQWSLFARKLGRCEGCALVILPGLHEIHWNHVKYLGKRSKNMKQYHVMSRNAWSETWCDGKEKAQKESSLHAGPHRLSLGAAVFYKQVSA